MLEYPIQLGLMTVIFACIVGFISYLFRPGNYTGVPGIAAGLAPALALGIHTFGMENMPFLIMLTASLQAVAWRFNIQRHLLRIVPPFLVEGLLAGIGLKIALKFYRLHMKHHILPLLQVVTTGFYPVLSGMQKQLLCLGCQHCLCCFL